MSCKPTMMNGKVLVPGRGAVAPVAIDPARDATGFVLVLEYLRTNDVGRIAAVKIHLKYRMNAW